MHARSLTDAVVFFVLFICYLWIEGLTEKASSFFLYLAFSVWPRETSTNQPPQRPLTWYQITFAEADSGAAMHVPGARMHMLRERAHPTVPGVCGETRTCRPFFSPAS